jgi:hypothetical protein
MEHQTAIAYGSGFEQTINPKFNYILVHETAHEWWGNSVSVSDFLRYGFMKVSLPILKRCITSTSGAEKVICST